MNTFQNCKIIGPNTPVGYYTQQEAERGDKEFVMSRGALMEFFKCPRRWLDGAPKDETKSTAWGSLIDCLALTSHAFNDQYAVAPLTYPAKPEKKGDPIVQKPWNRNATYCKEWEAAKGGKTILKEEEYYEAQVAVTRLKSDSLISSFLSHSKRQVMITADYVDRATDIAVPVKILIDLVPNEESEFGHGLGDLKTTESAEADDWTNSVFYFDYDVQSALYLDVFNAATGEERADFYHCVQENKPPYMTGRKLMRTAFIDLGRETYTAALKAYCRCLATGEWPDYDSHSRNNFKGWSGVEPKAWMVGKRQSVMFESGIIETKPTQPTEPDEVGIIP